jgi:hypothetical protein
MLREIKNQEAKARIGEVAAVLIADGDSIALDIDSTTLQIAQHLVGRRNLTVRDLILRYQPSLGLHGHIHEASGAIRLGRTVCINPGSEYSDGVLRGVLLSLDEKTGKFGYQLTTG